MDSEASNDGAHASLGAVPFVATRRIRSDTSGEAGLGLVVTGIFPTVTERKSKICPYAGIDELRQKVLFLGWLVRR